MIFKARKFMKRKDYLKIKNMLDNPKLTLKGYIPYPHQATPPNRIELVLEIELEEKMDE